MLNKNVLGGEGVRLPAVVQNQRVKLSRWSAAQIDSYDRYLHTLRPVDGDQRHVHRGGPRQNLTILGLPRCPGQR